MNYPVEILPQSKYKLINSDLNGHFLIRYTDKQPTDDSVLPGEVASPRDHILDLSTSLLGIFKYRFHKIRLTERGKQTFGAYCKPDQKVDPPKYLADFYIEENGAAWAVPIGAVDGQKAIIERNGQEDYISCSILHTPAKWNYWHFSIKWLDSQGNIITSFTKSHANKARVLIANNADWERPPYIGIPIEDYRKDWKAILYSKLKKAGLRKHIQWLISLYMQLKSR